MTYTRFTQDLHRPYTGLTHDLHRAYTRLLEQCYKICLPGYLVMHSEVSWSGASPLRQPNARDHTVTSNEIYYTIVIPTDD